ncbi:hypothetical protein TNCV_2940991 [Trichonephila clavipes]|nr:hypothetical protein TNCV_2940991 [Trichonephila clavipes]
MPTFKIALQVRNHDFACVVRADLVTIGFVSYNVVNTVGIVHYCKLSEKVSQRLPRIESLREKKRVVSHEDLLTINGSKCSTFQVAARVAGLSKSQNFINEVLNDAALVINLTEEEC